MNSDSFANLETQYPDFFDVGTLSIALIGPDERRRTALARALAECHGGGEVREFSSYPPSLDDVPRMLEQHYNVIIIDLDSNREYALELVESICANGMATVMVYSERDEPELMLRCMRSGVREFLTLPFPQSTMAEALVRAAARRPANPPKKVGGRLLVFFGAKGGSGVTTIACNFAVAVAQEASQSTLLIDLDLPLGDAALNLGLEAEYSTISALQESGRLDASFLSKLLVKHSSGLNVLAAPGKFPQYLASNESIDRLLAVARSQFDNVVVDAGSRLDFATTSLFKEAKTIYLVTQAGIPELRNSNRLIGQFFSATESKLEIVINRYQARALGVSDEYITKALTRPAQWMIPNDYSSVRQMQNTATPLVLEDSPISRLIREMASAVTGQPVPQEKKKGFSFLGRGRGASGKNGADDQPLSIMRVTPGPTSNGNQNGSNRPEARTNYQEPQEIAPFSTGASHNEPWSPPASSMPIDLSDEMPREVEKDEVMQNSALSNQSAELETRTYKGANYVKGTDGQWHLQSDMEAEVIQETPTITWPKPALIAYGTGLSSAQLNAKASVPGTFVYTPAARYILSSGTHTLWVTFTPTDTEKYGTAQAAVSLTVTRVAPAIKWPTPAPISYGTPLGHAQLNATTSMAGTFSYSPAVGELLPTGTKTLTVTFTPADATSYTEAQAEVTLTVTRATPTITWPRPAPIAYGTALSSNELNATSSVPGKFVYIPVAGAVLAAGTHTPSLIFSPTDVTNYTPAKAAVSLTVTKATPTITWPTPDSVSYGTPLSAAQLNATTSVPGTFVYTPAAGDVLTAGTQTLSVLFSPTDTVDYTTEEATVSITVTKAAPTIVTWPAPASISYGTPLTAEQLNATASVPGNFVYNPAEDEVLAAGTHSLKVTFTPTDTNFHTAEASVSLTVTVVAPAINWPTPNPIPFGTPLSATELNATAFVHGEFTYTPSEGTMLPAGEQKLSVIFTPDNTEDYIETEATVELIVTKAAPAITWSAPNSIPYGTSLSSDQLNATATVSGTFLYIPAAGTVLPAGEQALSVTFTPANTDDYITAQASVALVVEGFDDIDLPMTIDADDEGMFHAIQPDADAEQMFQTLHNNNETFGVPKRRKEGYTPLMGKVTSTDSLNEFMPADKSGRTEQGGSTPEQQGELETRTYKGATYVKGPDGQWHLQQK